MIADATGSRPLGWSSPSVYSNGDTPEAVAAEGVAYTLDQMDSDILQRLKTPEGPLMLLPYAAVTIDMGQETRADAGAEGDRGAVARLCSGTRRRARAEPTREATAVVIGITPLWSERLMGPPPYAVFSCASSRKTSSGSPTRTRCARLRARIKV
jgi:allantoinase